MKHLIFLYIIIIILFSGSLLYATNDECINCHVEEIEDMQGTMYKSDLHYKLGISCADCHGGNRKSDDPEEAMSKKAGFVKKPSKSKIVDICLSCHSNSEKMKKFNSEKSVKHLEYFKKSSHGTTEIATCITCHGIHNIKRVDDPKSPVYPLNEVKLCSKCHSDANYMKTFNPSLSTDQYDKYKTSIHGIKNMAGDIKTATCSDCHSAHNIFTASDPRTKINAFNIPETCRKCHSDAEYMKEYNIPTDQFDKYSKSVHGKALLEKHDISAPTCNDCHGNHGAIPVGVKSISHICGTCHALNEEMFGESPHAKVFEEQNIPQCEVCHGNHLIEHPTDVMLGVGKESACIKCHNEKTDKGFISLLEMKNDIDSLIFKQQLADDALLVAENKGMDVSDARYEILDIKKILITTRTIIHKANLEAFKEAIAPGQDIVNRAIIAGTEALDEFYFRRWGLGGSTLLITILVIALYLKLRKIEKFQKINK